MSAPRQVDRLEFETLLADISAHLITVDSDRLGETIEWTLDSVRQFFRVDRCALLAVSDDREKVHVAYASYADDAFRVSDDINLARLFPWVWHRVVIDRSTLAVSHVPHLPPEAALDRANCEAMGIRSFVDIPIEVATAGLHLIVLNAVQEEREWPEEYAPRLRLLGEILVNAIERTRVVTTRRRAEEALRESEERYRHLVDSSHDWVWEVDADGAYTYASPQCREILGYEPAELIGKKPFDLMPPEESRRVAAIFNAIAAKRKVFRGLENTNLHKARPFGGAGDQWSTCTR